MVAKKLSHITESGEAKMVDVGNKEVTERFASARGEVIMRPDTLSLIKNDLVQKGDVLAVARIAGISGAKKTSELIPLCHSLNLSSVKIDLELDHDLPGIIIQSEVKTAGRTGVEMEALTAVSVAALTIYDMAKSAEKSITIQNVRLIEKSGGKSGNYQADPRSNE